MQALDLYSCIIQDTILIKHIKLSNTILLQFRVLKRSFLQTVQISRNGINRKTKIIITTSEATIRAS